MPLFSSKGLIEEEKTKKKNKKELKKFVLSKEIIEISDYFKNPDNVSWLREILGEEEAKNFVKIFNNYQAAISSNQGSDKYDKAGILLLDELNEWYNSITPNTSETTKSELRKQTEGIAQKIQKNINKKSKKPRIKKSFVEQIKNFANKIKNYTKSSNKKSNKQNDSSLLINLQNLQYEDQFQKINLLYNSFIAHFTNSTNENIKNITNELRQNSNLKTLMTVQETINIKKSELVKAYYELENLTRGSDKINNVELESITKFLSEHKEGILRYEPNYASINNSITSGYDRLDFDVPTNLIPHLPTVSKGQPPEPSPASAKPEITLPSYTSSNIEDEEPSTFIPPDPTKGKPTIPPKTSSHSEKFEDLSNAEKIDLVLTGMFFNTPAGEKFSAKTSPQVLSTPNFEEKSGDTEHFKNKPTPAPRTKTRSNTPTNVDKTPILTPQRQVEESVVPQTHEIGAAAQDLAHVGVKLIRKRLQPSHLPASLKEMATKIEIHSNEFQPTQKLRSDLHLEEPKESPVHYVPPRSKSLRQNVRTIIDKFEPTKQNAHTPAMKPKPDSFRTSENTQKKQKVSDAVHNVDLKIKERIEELRSANNIPKVNITIQPGKLERYNDITSELPKHLNKKMNTVNSLTSQKPLLPPKPQRPPRGNPKSPERGK